MADLTVTTRQRNAAGRLPGVRLRVVAIAVLAVALAISVAMLAMIPSVPQPKGGAFQAQTTPTEGVSAAEAYKNLRATEQAQLTTYGWVDRQNGIVHIPIDKAMEIILQRGLPTRPPQ